MSPTKPDGTLKIGSESYCYPVPRACQLANPHDRKGGGLIVKIPNFCERTLSECLFEIPFSHNTFMVKPRVCRVRHEEH